MIQILCPANTVSGGPEAMHQLCHVLRRQGENAAIIYYPFKDGGSHYGYSVPAPYLGYDVALRSEPIDEPNVVVVIPEVATGFACQFHRARKVIWWLSVDNFFKWRHLNQGPSIFEQIGCLHVAQSEYAMDFLRKQKLPCHYLTDFIPESAFTLGSGGPRPPIVAYNPRKGIEVTKALIKRCGDAPIWLKLEALSQEEVAEVLQMAAIYIDFGPHPGRDRLPREASRCGAVVITGKRGATRFPCDVPLPNRFKIEETESNFEDRAAGLILDLLSSSTILARAFSEQEPYREWIAQSRKVFSDEVDRFVRLLNVGAIAEPTRQNEAVS